MRILCEVSEDRVVISIGTMLMSGTASFRTFELIIDFSKCFYIDSRAIALIISANRRSQLGKTRLVIQNANDEITELLHAIQINKIIEMA